MADLVADPDHIDDGGRVMREMSEELESAVGQLLNVDSLEPKGTFEEREYSEAWNVVKTLHRDLLSTFITNLDENGQSIRDQAEKYRDADEQAMADIQALEGDLAAGFSEAESSRTDLREATPDDGTSMGYDSDGNAITVY